MFSFFRGTIIMIIRSDCAVKCIFCGGIMNESEVQHHLKDYHKIKPNLINSRFRETEPEPPSPDDSSTTFSYNDQHHLATTDEKQDNTDADDDDETDNSNVLERFKCPMCSFVSLSRSEVSNHVISCQENSSASTRKRKSSSDPEPLKQKMMCRIQPLNLSSLTSDRRNSEDKIVEPELTSNNTLIIKKIKQSQRCKPSPSRKQVKRRTRKSHVQSDNTITQDSVVEQDNFVEEVSVVEDDDCVILEQVIQSAPTVLSDSEQSELNQILQSCVDEEEDTIDNNNYDYMSPTPGPSKLYTCHLCPQRFDTWTPLLDPGLFG